MTSTHTSPTETIETEDIAYTVEVTESPNASNSASNRYVYAYSIRLENTGQDTLKLRQRHWCIIDANGHKQVVDGEGVVGLQPTLAPGQAFTYSSHAILATPWGTMEGHYLLENLSQGALWAQVNIARFYLAPEAN